MCILYWEENVSGKGQARFGIFAAKKSSRAPAVLLYFFIAGKI